MFRHGSDGSQSTMKIQLRMDGSIVLMWSTGRSSNHCRDSRHKHPVAAQNPKSNVAGQATQGRAGRKLPKGEEWVKPGAVCPTIFLRPSIRPSSETQWTPKRCRESASSTHQLHPQESGSKGPMRKPGRLAFDKLSGVLAPPDDSGLVTIFVSQQ